MSDTIWQLVEKWDKRDPYSLGKDELERCKRELKQALAAAPALAAGRVRQECVEAGVDCIRGINYFELTKRLNALLTQPAPRHKLINKDHFPALCPACRPAEPQKRVYYTIQLPALCPACRPAEPAPDSPDNYCSYGVPIASDECELCPPGTHKVLDSAGSNLRAAHAGREHAASPEQPAPALTDFPQGKTTTQRILAGEIPLPEMSSFDMEYPWGGVNQSMLTKPAPPQDVPETWAGPPEPDEIEIMNARLGPGEPAPSESTSAISIAEEWLRAHDFNDLAIKIYGKSLARLIISAQQETLDMAAQTAEVQRLGTGPQGVAYAIRALKEALEHESGPVGEAPQSEDMDKRNEW